MRVNESKETEPFFSDGEEIEVDQTEDVFIGGEEKIQIGSASVFNSVLNATNTVVGYSIVTLPYIFYLNGIVLGSILVLFFGILSYYVLTMLVHATAVSKQNSFREIATFTFGNIPGIALECILMIQMFGISVIYTILIGQILVPFFQTFFSNSTYVNNFTVMMVIMLFILFPISSLKKLEFIGYGSLIAILCACYFGTAVSIRFVQKLFFTYKGISFTSINWVNPTIGNVIRSISYVGFSYGCHSSVPQIYKELKDKSESKMNYAMLITIINCFIIFMVIGISGYIQVILQYFKFLVCSYCSI
jgi:solute carrier family 38 (sodium-coupled neutral amino acid transporter), member 6